MNFILGIVFFVTQVSGLGFGHQALGLRGSIDASAICEQSTVGGAIGSHNLTLTTYNLKLPEFTAHDYHISNFEIEYNAETKALEIIAKIFIDDMEDGIANSGVEEKLYLCTDREIESGDDYVFNYLTEKLKINVNGQDVSFNFIGKEVGEELVAMYCYLEVENIASVEEITISNDMLMELFDDQINIIKLISKSNSKRGFMMLKKGAHSDTVLWN